MDYMCETIIIIKRTYTVSFECIYQGLNYEFYDIDIIDVILVSISL